MTLRYPVNSAAATQVFPQAKQGVLTVYNEGPSTVYVDEGSSVNERSLMLPPLSSVVWSAGQPLFAKCVTGESNITVDLQGQFLDTSRSSYMKDILTVSNFTGTSEEFECGSYASLVFSGSVKSTFVPNPAIVGFTVYWYDANGQFLNYEGLVFWAGDSGPMFNGVIPVKGYRAHVVLNTNVGSNTIANFRVSGSTRTVPTSNTISQSRVWYPTNQTLAVASFFRDTLALTPWDGSVIYLPAISNDMQVAINYNATVAGVVDIVEKVNGNIYANIQINAAPGLGRTTLTAPTSVPLAIQKSAVFPPTFTSASLTITWLNV